MASFSITSCRGGRPIRISNPVVGVVFTQPDIPKQVMCWLWVKRLLTVVRYVLFHQISAAYINIVLITEVYISNSFRPHVFPIALRHCQYAVSRYIDINTSRSFRRYFSFKIKQNLFSLSFHRWRTILY
jgi:hypothetical protein